MGWKFRKSVKILPGVRLNFGKKSTSVSIGGKHGGVTVNSKGGVTARASIPGAGISYSEKIRSNSPPATSKQGKSVRQKEAENYIRIIRESAQIIETTTNPEIFFSRYDLLLETCDRLCTLEKYVSLSGSPKSQAEKAAAMYGEKTSELIARCYEDAFQKSQSLKTKTGRENRIKKARDTLMLCSDKMTDHHTQEVEKLCLDYLQKC